MTLALAAPRTPRWRARRRWPGRAAASSCCSSARCSVGPRMALAITAPALLLGNLHRAAALPARASIAESPCAWSSRARSPARSSAGLLAGAIPEWALHVLLVGLTGLAIARALRGSSLRRSALRRSHRRASSIGRNDRHGGRRGCAVRAGAPLVGAAWPCLSSRRSARLPSRRTSGGSSRTHRTASSRAIWRCRSRSSRSRSSPATRSGERVRSRLPDRLTTRLEYGVLVVCAGVSLAGAG